MQRLELGGFTSEDLGHTADKELIESFILHAQAELIVESRWSQLLSRSNVPLPKLWVNIFLLDVVDGADPEVAAAEVYRFP